MTESANTSIKQVPATLKRIMWVGNSTHIDYGCGKYPELFFHELEARGVKVYGYDPAWYPDWFNGEVPGNPVDSITLNNVLNVIESPTTIRNTLADMMKWVNDSTVVYILIYEGDRSWEGKHTTKGFQHNKPTQYYEQFLTPIFEGVERKGNLLICSHKKICLTKF